MRRPVALHSRRLHLATVEEACDMRLVVRPVSVRVAARGRSGCAGYRSPSGCGCNFGPPVHCVASGVATLRNEVSKTIEKWMRIG